MAPQSVMLFDGKKYLWDGETYEDEGKAKEKESEYKGNNFETQVIQEEGKWLIYTRRVVEEVVVEGSP